MELCFVFIVVISFRWYRKKILVGYAAMQAAVFKPFAAK